MRMKYQTWAEYEHVVMSRKRLVWFFEKKAEKMPPEQHSGKRKNENSMDEYRLRFDHIVIREFPLLFADLVSSLGVWDDFSDGSVQVGEWAGCWKRTRPWTQCKATNLRWGNPRGRLKSWNEYRNSALPEKSLKLKKTREKIGLDKSEGTHKEKTFNNIEEWTGPERFSSNEERMPKESNI